MTAALASNGAFPNLQMMSMAGFSAGGQMTNRYSLAPTWGGPLQPSTNPSNVKIRFLMGDAGSHFYLNTLRPAVSCRPAVSLTNNNFSCPSFAVPATTDPYNIDSHLPDTTTVNTESVTAALFSEGTPLLTQTGSTTTSPKMLGSSLDQMITATVATLQWVTLQPARKPLPALQTATLSLIAATY